MRFSEAQIKLYIFQILTGLHYCHNNQILHRDIKLANLFLTEDHEVKIGDFGLARSFTGQDQTYTNRVITLWYRPPELLMGETRYSTEIDIWSVGCIFAEMLCRKPLFPGREENNATQCEIIFQVRTIPSFLSLFALN
jgi:cyclin-dependent kinase 12/13